MKGGGRVPIREAVAVEGKYDQIRLSSLIDAPIVVLGGFGIFHDEEKRRLLTDLALSRGLIVFTDSDGAGFVLRNFLNGCLPADRLKHAYLPEIAGKERRKAVPSKEGLLGVEGVDDAVLLACLRRAGATFLDEEDRPVDGGGITRQQLYEDGLIGGPDSARLRRRLLARLGYPQKCSTNALLMAINTALTVDTYHTLLEALRREAAGETSE